MTAETKTIIVTAIRGDRTIAPSEKSRMIRYINNPAKGPDVRFFTEAQAALVLGVSVRTVQRMKADKQLETRTVRGSNRITAESVYRYSQY